MEGVGTPEFNYGIRRKIISTSPFHLDLLTPPPSEGREKSLDNFIHTSSTDTPLSHRPGDSSFPRAFTRKCNISASYGKSSTVLSSIEEERGEDSVKHNVAFQNLPLTNIIAGAITPESPPSRKRGYFSEEVQEMQYSNEIQAENKSRESESVDSTSILSSVENTPRKRVKTLHFHNQALLNAEQKENSPIKVIFSNHPGGGLFSNKSRDCLSLLLKPPPIPLVLRQFEKQQEKREVDIMSGLYDKNLYHVIHKILNCLNPLDLVNTEKVSVRWQQIVTDVVSGQLGRAKKLALTSKENLLTKPAPLKCQVKCRNETTPRKMFVKVRNSIDSPKRPASPNLSPKTKRFQAFVKEGMTLSPTKKLEKCPLCRFPARATNEQCAVCSACKVTFCIQCRCSPHPHTPCNFVLSSSPSPLKISKRPCVASKASRKALRRLIN